MSFDAETAGNFEEIEMQFAVKTVEHLEVCFLLWCEGGEAGADGRHMRN